MPDSAPESAGKCLFQSAPDREVGRCLKDKIGTARKYGFNPRPTVRSGDAIVRDAETGEQRVSIRARP